MPAGPDALGELPAVLAGAGLRDGHAMVPSRGQMLDAGSVAADELLRGAVRGNASP
jgi:hypothetical protein